jgi:hypothetical protein
VAKAVGDGLRAFAPKNLKAVRDAAGGAGTGGSPPGGDRGYSQRQRKSLDALVEKSR